MQVRTTCKALSFCCVSTAFISKTVPFHVVPLVKNWYVYNHIMFERWLLEDVTAAVDAEFLELLPSLLGPVATTGAAHLRPPPAVNITAGADWAVAKAWRDTGYEARTAGGLCVHLAVASLKTDRPAGFELTLTGLSPPGTPLAAAGSREGAAGDAGGGLNATHIFVEDYSVPLEKTRRGSGSDEVW
eukprot:SAG22_NODE_3612_length_1616_cov_1.926170_2_plen_187_part_00